MIGSFPIADGPIAQTTEIPIPSFYPRQFVMDQPVADLNLGPLLTFYEIQPAGGLNPERLVDTSSHQEIDIDGWLAFNGHPWRITTITRSSVGESTDATQPEITATVFDFDHSVIKWIEENNGLEKGEVTIYVIAYADIDHPEKALSRTLKVKKVTSEEGPARVTVHLGSPTFFDYRFPRHYFNRHTCHHAYTRRHIHDLLNGCDYPSDHFQRDSMQVFAPQAAAQEVALFNGWYVENGNKADYCRSGIAVGGGLPLTTRGLTAEGAGVTARWEGSTRTGLFCLKKFAAVDEEQLDMGCKLRVITSYDPTMAGLLIQSGADLGDWIFFGLRYNGTQVDLITKETLNNTTTTTVRDAATSYTAVRLQRTASGWNLLAKSPPLADMEADDDYAWIEVGTISDVIGAGNDMRAGVVICPDQAAASQFWADVFYWRVFKGGLPTCRKTLTDCIRHGNTTQLGAFVGLPDGIARW